MNVSRVGPEGLKTGKHVPATAHAPDPALRQLPDAFGSPGNCAVMLLRNFGAPQMSWLDFFIGGSYAMALGVVLMTGAAVLYFRRKLDASRAPAVGRAEFAGSWRAGLSLPPFSQTG